MRRTPCRQSRDGGEASKVAEGFCSLHIYREMALEPKVNKENAMPVINFASVWGISEIQEKLFILRENAGPHKSIKT